MKAKSFSMKKTKRQRNKRLKDEETEKQGGSDL